MSLAKNIYLKIFKNFMGERNPGGRMNIIFEEIFT